MIYHHGYIRFNAPPLTQRFPVLAVPTNEEKAIAEATVQVTAAPHHPHPEHRTHPLSLLLLNQNKQQSGRTQNALG